MAAQGQHQRVRGFSCPLQESERAHRANPECRLRDSGDCYSPTNERLVQEYYRPLPLRPGASSSNKRSRQKASLAGAIRFLACVDLACSASQHLGSIMLLSSMLDFHRREAFSAVLQVTC